MKVQQNIKIQFIFTPVDGEPITNTRLFNKLRPVDEWSIPERINCGCVYEFTEIPTFQEYQNVIDLLWFGILRPVSLVEDKELKEVTTKTISHTTMLVAEDEKKIEPQVPVFIEEPVVIAQEEPSLSPLKKQRVMNGSAEEALHDCFYDAENRVPTQEEVRALFDSLPEDIHRLAREWGWSDTEVRDAVFVFIMASKGQQ